MYFNVLGEKKFATTTTDDVTECRDIHRGFDWS